jgi:hypothetical protein
MRMRFRAALAFHSTLDFVGRTAGFWLGMNARLPDIGLDSDLEGRSGHPGANRLCVQISGVLVQVEISAFAVIQPRWNY